MADAMSRLRELDDENSAPLPEDLFELPDDSPEFHKALHIRCLQTELEAAIEKYEDLLREQTNVMNTSKSVKMTEPG